MAAVGASLELPRAFWNATAASVQQPAVVFLSKMAPLAGDSPYPPEGAFSVTALHDDNLDFKNARAVATKVA